MTEPRTSIAPYEAHSHTRTVLEDNRGMAVASFLGAAAAAAGLAGLPGVPFAAVFVLVALRVARLQTPEKHARRLAERAVTTVPAEPGWTVLRGVLRSCADPLPAPFSARPCVAYWSRHVEPLSEHGPTVYDVAIHSTARDFVLDCGGTLVQVEAIGAQIVYDRRHGEVIAVGVGKPPHRSGAFRPMTDEDMVSPRRQEIIVAVGDPVVVAGQLARDAGDGPYRAGPAPAVRLSRSRVQRVVVSLLRPPS